MMGERQLDSTLRAFGYGKKTGVPLKPETAGIVRPLHRWDKLSITRFPIGQGIAASPLQIVRSYCILANGGHPVNLRLVDRIENPATGKVEKIPVVRQPCGDPRLSCGGQNRNGAEIHQRRIFP